ncbi:MAG: hypothetical protein ACOC8D_02390 [bacterium]
MATRSGRARRTLSTRGKIALAVGAPVVFLGLLEAGLRLAAYGAEREQPAAYDYIRPKPPGTVRVMVVGGSAAAGWPFHPRGGPVPLLRELLGDVAPGQRAEVLNCAVNSLTSDGVRMLVRRLVEHEPDVLIVACGHNEFFNDPSFNRLIAGWDPRLPGLLERSRVALLLQDMTTFVGGGPPRDRDGPMTRAERAQAGRIGSLSDYQPGDLAEPLAENLRTIVQRARSRGAAIVLTTLPTNLRDVPPNRPRHRLDLTDAQRDAWQSHYAEGQALARQGNHEAALAAFEEARAIDETHAGLLYAHARSLDAVGRHDLARDLFAAARDADYLPTRTTRFRNDAVRAVARQAEAGLCDAERAFEEAAPHGIPGDALFCDHVHLTLKGAMLLARAWAMALEHEELLGESAGWDWSAARSREAYEEALELTAAFRARAWADVGYQCALAESGGVRVRAFRRPQLVEALRARGLACLMKAQELYPAALEEVASAPNPYARCYAARAYLAAGEAGRAVEICEELLDRAPRFALAYEVTAEARMALGDTEGAAQARRARARVLRAARGGDSDLSDPDAKEQAP